MPITGLKANNFSSDSSDLTAIRNLLGLGTANDTAFRSLTLSGQSLTGSQATSLASLSATWNTTGTPTAIDLNVTDTASNANSLLMNLRRNGTTAFSVSKTGNLTCGNVGSNVNTYFLDNSVGALRLWTDAWLSRLSSGTMRIGTAKNTADGSLNLTNLTASDGSLTITRTTGTSHTIARWPTRFSGTTDALITSLGGGLFTGQTSLSGFSFPEGTTILRLGNGGSAFAFFGQDWNAPVIWTHENKIRSAGAAVQFRNHNDTGDQGIVCGNLTASGLIAANKTYTSTTNFEQFIVDATTDVSNYRIGSRIGSAGGTTRGLQFGNYNAGGTWTSWLGVDSLGTNVPSTSGHYVNGTIVLRHETWGYRYYVPLLPVTAGSYSLGLQDIPWGNVFLRPPASVTLNTNSVLSFEMTSNTAGNLVYRGSDGVTRRMALTFS